MTEAPPQEQVLTRSVRFNQDGRCLAVACKDGFRVFSSDPLREIFHRPFSFGFRIVEMLYTSNIVALVGDGTSPSFPVHKVIMWNDFHQRKLGELVFSTPVVDVRLRSDKIIVALETRVYVYSFDDLRLIDQLDFPHLQALQLAVTPSGDCLVVTPSQDEGEIAIRNYSISPTSLTCIGAHEHALQCIAISPDGSLIATASDRGTLIRVFATETSSLIAEYRRGKNPAVIGCMAFSANSAFLAISSDHGTVHVFQLPQKTAPAIKPGAIASPRAFAKFSLADHDTVLALSFSASGRAVLAACTSGSYQVLNFLPDNGKPSLTAVGSWNQ